MKHAGAETANVYGVGKHTKELQPIDYNAVHDWFLDRADTERDN